MTEESNQQSKSKRGGRRPGAGRKPGSIKGLLKKLPTPTAELILQAINAEKRLINLANSKNEFVALRTICFLWEQAYGKAKQSIEHKEVPELTFGNLRLPSFSGNQPGSADKPN